MDLKLRPSSSESDGENVDTSVKILINDITPCDSREFLHLPGTLLQVPSQNDLRRPVEKQPFKGILQRRASWACPREPKQQKKLKKCPSLGSIDFYAERAGFSGQNAISLDSHLSNQKGSSDSIPEGIKEKQRSFSAGSREDVFMFSNQLQNSVQSMNDMISRGSTQLLSANVVEPKPVKKHSLVGIGQEYKEEWLITPRSTLQKSVSTPSIVAAQEIQEIAHRRGGKDRSYGRNRATIQNVRNSCIEIMHEDDEPEEMNIKRLSSFSLANLLRENLLKSGQPEDEDKPFSKRKKRGSLFFRKKKESAVTFKSIQRGLCTLLSSFGIQAKGSAVTFKSIQRGLCTLLSSFGIQAKNKEKENKKNSVHHFVAICISTSATCDVCNRALANKSALKCETCSVTIHDSSCKDHVPNCVQSKNPQPAGSEKEYDSSLLTPAGSYPYRYRNFVGSSSLVHSHSSVSLGKNSQPSKEKRSSIGDTARIVLSSSSDTSKTSSSNTPRKNYTPSPYSQWRRVATKLGVNKVICEEKEVEPVEDVNSNILETNSASMESLDDASQGTSDVEDDALTQLLDEEPESWNGTVDKKMLKRLKEKDVKRQEAIYELILTEKHHCLTLKIMQRVFAKGMVQELNVSKDMVQRIFPCLEDLIRIHLAFLHKLRERQRQETVVSHIGDIILNQFQGQNAEELCTYYSQFCSQHKEALSLYKDIMKSDRKFQSFVKRCGTKSFCKTRGIPECILLVTQRITKYSLLIDALIKTTKDNKHEVEKLTRALNNVKDIVTQVNSAVAEKDREVRLLEIYNRIDAKSTAFFKRKKFKKSDLLNNNRKLRYEGTLEWKSARGKVIEVHVIILSDVIVLLQENNQKYTFASLDNKAAVISLQKLLVREKAGQNSRGIYLISSNPNDPEMYEMLCSSPKDKKLWLQVIRDSVTMLTSEESKGFVNAGDRTESSWSSDDEKSSKLTELCATMQEKDLEIVTLCEEKLKAMIEALVLLGYERQKLPNVDLQHLLQKDEDETEQCLLATLNQACLLTSQMFYFNTNPHPPEHTTSASMSPVLPKRAETFAGFDNSGREMSDKVNVLKKKLTQLKEIEGEVHNERELSSSDSSLHVKSKSEAMSHLKFISQQGSPEKVSEGDIPKAFSVHHRGYNRLNEAAELNYLLSMSVGLLHHHMSLYRKEFSKRRYRPDHQLEELRNIQEKLSQERLQWQHEKAKEEKDLEKMREELLQLQKFLYNEKSKLQLQGSSDSRLSSSAENKDLTLSCPSLGLCKHKRSASYDFRNIGNITHEIGGRQSWSGPVDDTSPLACRSHMCSSQSTSDIPHSTGCSPPAFTNQNVFYQQFKSPESSTSSCNSIRTKDSDSQNLACHIPRATDDVNLSHRNCVDLSKVNHRPFKCLCPETEVQYEHCTSNGPETLLVNKPLCRCQESR